MKWCSLAMLVLLVCAHIPAGSPAMSKAAMNQMKNTLKSVCKNKTGVKQEYLTQSRKGDFPDDRKLKCYVQCIMGMMQVMKNGKINVEGAIKQAETLLPPELKEPSLKQLNGCKDTQGTEPCQLAWDFAMCAYKIDPENFLIPT